MPSPQHKSGQSPRMRLAGLGVELAGAVLGFTLLGIWIDRHYGTYPWGLLICVICGLVGGFYNFIRSSLQALSKSGSDRPDSAKRDGSDR